MLNVEKFKERHFFNIKIIFWQFLENKFSSKWLGEAKEKTKIMAIFNKYKNSFKDFVNNLDIKLLYMSR